ncbi:ribose transport system substrate-binding protein [Pseudoxanthobacter soli DSM 19599]|uniref:Ribose transport system substrate-binding protein n=1 Tax=Pseudoxanthobacter soli DSM 19599 TaxID=1123029 RepID=A0A1M7ZH84_9HYPH|nr:ABC transporter substrate-binding protein [Pseudoxanthobacter soli]SHO64248.1 ribose transport system substrate-binding protein [Pseudoxanthobacter soli DSM 19599]
MKLNAFTPAALMCGVAVLFGGVLVGSLGAATPAAADPVKIAALPGQVGIPFYTSMQCGAQAAAKEFDVKLSWAGPPDWDIAQQQPFIDAALQLKPQGVILAPTDSGALVSQVEAIEAGGTPVVTVDAPLDKPVETQSIQSNHYLGGEAAAKAMNDVAGGDGTFVVVGMRPGLPDIDARVKGFVDTFSKENPKATILPVLYPETSSTKAAEQVAAAIQANPDLKGVYVTHSAAAEGASAAILEAGMRGKIKLISFDADPQQIRDLRDGVYDALIVQEPYQMGYDAVKTLAELVRGKIKKSDVQHDHFLPSVIVTRENMSDPKIAASFYKATCD